MVATGSLCGIDNGNEIDSGMPVATIPCALSLLPIFTAACYYLLNTRIMTSNHSTSYYWGDKISLPLRALRVTNCSHKRLYAKLVLGQDNPGYIREPGKVVATGFLSGIDNEIDKSMVNLPGATLPYTLSP